MAKRKITDPATEKARTPKKDPAPFDFNKSMEELASMLAQTPTQPRHKSTIELLNELSNELAATEAYGASIHDFLHPEGKLAPVVESLPVDPNARLVFLISHLKILQGTLNSVARILGAV